MPIDFYYTPVSAPCRAIIMLAKQLNIEFNYKLVDVMAGHHLKPEFGAINPEHRVPTIVDNNFVLWESRVILQYLASKFKSDLYPQTDLQSRAIVDRLLYFDSSPLYSSVTNYFYPKIFGNKPLKEEKHKQLKHALTMLDSFIANNKYVCGNELTIADFSILATITFPYYLFDYDYGEWKNISRWLTKMIEELPYFYKVNEVPYIAFRAQLFGQTTHL